MPRGGDTPPPVGGQFDINVEVEICSDSLASLPWKANLLYLTANVIPWLGNLRLIYQKINQKKSIKKFIK